VETYHSGMRSFLCGASGWQKWRGMGAPGRFGARISMRPET
jgi:hypothetical protein